MTLSKFRTTLLKTRHRRKTPARRDDPHLVFRNFVRALEQMHAGAQSGAPQKGRA